MPLAAMIQGKKGMTTYQLLDGFEIDGKEKKYDLEYSDVGEIVAIHIKSFYGKGIRPKQLLIDVIYVHI